MYASIDVFPPDGQIWDGSPLAPMYELLQKRLVWLGTHSKTLRGLDMHYMVSCILSLPVTQC